MQSEDLVGTKRLEVRKPIDRLMRSLTRKPGSIFLDSGSHEFGLGEYSILVTDPVKEFLSFGSSLEVRKCGERQVFEGDPFQYLRDELSLSRPVKPTYSQLPFSGGAVGYMAYDLGYRLKPSTLKRSSGFHGPDMRFGIYDAALVWDHSSGELFAMASPHSRNPEEALSKLELTVKEADELESPRSFRVGKISSNFSRNSYMNQIGRIKEYIREGEIYQANFSQSFRATFEGRGIDLYHRLRKVNPAPYAAYMNFGDEEILSSSPERFLKHERGFVSTRPIKGTRPRGSNENEERIFREALSNSEKDQAELLMIVDLERNDLGRVCEPGTIKVKDLYGLETYASVIHQTANVEGKLSNDCDVIDCIEAMFPGGSITGAPKIRAMEIIDALEIGNRGMYTGSIGYIGFDGSADFNIAIRTMRIADGKISFNVGGGIVWDSDPKSEYEETLLKAKSLFEALGRGGRDVC